MVENDLTIWAALSAVLNGSASNEEKSLVNAWMDQCDENRKFVELLDNDSGKNVLPDVDTRERIYSRIEAAALPVKKVRRIGLRVPAVAAAATIIVMLGLFGLLFNRGAHDEMVYLESVTPFGVKTKFRLSDSTWVYLNAGTTLEYPAQFKGKTREVFLKGEAYFEVSKDADHPFIVKTSNIAIQVLGTHFNVKSFPEENLFEATLLEGSVKLCPGNTAKNTKPVTLQPNQKAWYCESTGEIEIQEVNAKLEVSWKDGKFYFDNQRLHLILTNLERNYNVPIRICSPELHDEVYSGLFDKNRTVYQTLDIMKLHNDFYYQTRNDTILIYKTR